MSASVDRWHGAVRQLRMVQRESGRAGHVCHNTVAEVIFRPCGPCMSRSKPLRPYRRFSPVGPASPGQPSHFGPRAHVGDRLVDWTTNPPGPLARDPPFMHRGSPPVRSMYRGPRSLGSRLVNRSWGIRFLRVNGEVAS